MKVLTTFLYVVLLWACTVTPARACTMVEGDRVLGRHLAAEAPAFASLDANVDVGPAPHAGSRRIYRTFELERIAAKHDIALPTGDAPTTEACFERATQILTTELLREALGPGSGIEVDILDYSKNPLPLGKLDFPPSGLDQTGLWRGRLIYGDNRSIPIWVRISAPGIQSKEPAVARGETVVVSVIRGGVRLSFESAAETSAHVGEAVTVRNPVNGKRFRAVVEAKGQVVILP